MKKKVPYLLLILGFIILNSNCSKKSQASTNNTNISTNTNPQSTTNWDKVTTIFSDDYKATSYYSNLT